MPCAQLLTQSSPECVGFFYICRLMKTLKPIGSIFHTLGVVFLFLLGINISFPTPSTDIHRQRHFVSKDTGLPSPSENQFLYEEKETEKDDELQDNYSLFCFPIAPLLQVIAADEKHGSCAVSRADGSFIKVPFYLSQRALLI